MKKLMCCHVLPPLSGTRSGLQHEAYRSLVCVTRGYASRNSRGEGGRSRFDAARLHAVPPSTRSSCPHRTAAAATGFDEGMLDALLSLSLALYEDEALGTAATTPTQRSAASAEGNVHAILADSTAAPFTAQAPLLEGGQRADAHGRTTSAPPEDAYASMDPDDLMRSMSMMDSTLSGGAQSENNARTPGVAADDHSEGNRGGGASRTTEAAAPQPASSSAGERASMSFVGKSLTEVRSGALVAPLASLLTSEEAPLEQKLLALMDAVGAQMNDAPCAVHENARKEEHSDRGFTADGREQDSTDLRRRSKTMQGAAAPLVEASSLLLAGLDMKAVLKRGELTGQHLRFLSLPRCDFSHVRWSSMTVDDCDLSRCIFYQAAWHDVVFRRCNFAGVLLKGVQCSGAVRFEDCEFRLAGMGLSYVAEGPRDAHTGAPDTRSARGRGPHKYGVSFVRCNFDLSDFQFSSGISDPASFAGCSNTHLASRFPLRARGSVN